jgi:hypothetical protein
VDGFNDKAISQLGSCDYEVGPVKQICKPPLLNNSPDAVFVRGWIMWKNSKSKLLEKKCVELTRAEIETIPHPPTFWGKNASSREQGTRKN